MITGTLCNKVFFSRLLPERCPVTWKGIEAALIKHEVKYSFIYGTKDIWCRDFMPVQVMDNRFALFRYEPDYLLDSDCNRATITDNTIASRYIGTSNIVDYRGIKIDGGNIIYGYGKAIMTSKVFEENPQWPPLRLLEYLTRILGAEIIILPWDAKEIYGHTDGIVRIIDEDTVLMTNYAQYDRVMAERYNRVLHAHFKNVHELYFDAVKPHKYSWAYINWLQTDKLLILPSFGISEDEQAFKQIERLMPEYKGRIVMVDANDLIIHEGCLNCASWTIFDTPNRDLPWCRE